MWKQLVKIQNSQISIGRMYLSIDQNYEENLNKLSGWLDRLSIPIRSIKKANSIDWREFLIGRKIEEIHHKVSGWLDRLSIPVRSIEKGTFDQLKGILDRLKFLKLNFLEFSSNNFQWFFMNILWSYEYNRLSLRSKTEFHWCCSLEVQSNILNIKLKQHHNINISFYQTVISTSI